MSGMIKEMNLDVKFINKLVYLIPRTPTPADAFYNKQEASAKQTFDFKSSTLGNTIDIKL